MHGTDGRNKGARAHTAARSLTLARGFGRLVLLLRPGQDVGEQALHAHCAVAERYVVVLWCGEFGH